MLSLFIKKLLFTRQFFMIDGKFEVLGEKMAGIPLSALFLMQSTHPDSCFSSLKQSSHETMNALFKKLGLRSDGIIEDLPELFTLFGLGKLQVIDIDLEKKHAIVQVHETPIIRFYTDKPPCSIVCGVLSGVFSAVFGSDAHATVNKCVAEGRDCCEFIIKQQ